MRAKVQKWPMEAGDFFSLVRSIHTHSGAALGVKQGAGFYVG